MADPGNGASRFQVHCSGAILDVITSVHRVASRRGIGNAVTRAFRQIIRRLEADPFQVGEPEYRLPGLRMQIRRTILSPLVVEFGVCEDRLLVFIKGVKLLSGKSS